MGSHNASGCVWYSLGVAPDIGYRNEDEAFLLQFGRGIGLSLWERPIISRRYMGQNTVLKEGILFAVECWKGAADVDKPGAEKKLWPRE